MLRKILFLVLLIFLISSLRGQWREVQLDQGDMAADLAEALSFTKYPTYPQYVEMMHLFAQEYPEICRLDTFGITPQGRLLLALKISDHVEKDEAEAGFLYTSNIHGDELPGYPLMLRLIDYLLSGYGIDDEVTRLVENLAIWINPLANPDGSYFPDDDFSLVNSQRGTATGIDLNRDFPDRMAGDVVNDTAGRAQETKNMMAFLQKQGFHMSANIHSGAEVVNYPWDHSYELHADDEWFRFVSREYADEARAVDPEYMALFEDGITNGAQWYKVNGGRQDYVNAYLEGREITLELSNDYRLESEQLDEYWMKNERSLLNYMAQCLYGIRGRVRDSKSGAPLEALIEIPGHDHYHSAVHSSADSGDFYRFLHEGTYELVFSAPGYLSDTIPVVQVESYRATTLDLSLEPLASSAGNSKAPSVRLYPNPANEQLFIEASSMEAGELEIKIFSMEGVLLHREQQYFSGSVLALGLEDLAAGPYLIKISSTSGSWVKMLIRH